MKLSWSGRPIEDQQDAQLVREYIEYMEAFHSSRAGRFGYRVGPWVVMPGLVASLILGALRTDWVQLLVALLALILYVLALVPIQSWRKSMRPTARINRWL